MDLMHLKSLAFTFLSLQVRCAKQAFSKMLVCVFICFATKAIHLELIKDLYDVVSTWPQTICTRRSPWQSWSDNATNFDGARNELPQLRRLFLSNNLQRATLDFFLAEAVDWCFIPPRSTHLCGPWETAVKIAKHHFYRAVGTAVIAVSDRSCGPWDVIFRSVVNSRPLVSI